MSERIAAGQPRGKPLTGARRIAGYMWDDEEQWRSVYSLDREEFGLIDLNGKITGFTGWIDAALERRVGKKRRRRQRHAEVVVAT